MQSDDEIIAVVQAHKEGKKIQWKERCAPQLSWVDLRESTTAGWFGWDFKNLVYRVAPEPPKPREFWLIRDEPERLSCTMFRAYQCYQIGVEGEQIHVMEVLGASSGNPTVNSGTVSCNQ